MYLENTRIRGRHSVSLQSHPSTDVATAIECVHSSTNTINNNKSHSPNTPQISSLHTTHTFFRSPQIIKSGQQNAGICAPAAHTLLATTCTRQCEWQQQPLLSTAFAARHH